MDIMAGYIRSSMLLNFVQVCSISRPWHYNIIEYNLNSFFSFLLLFNMGVGDDGLFKK
jgi:hypothetical protein